METWTLRILQSCPWFLECPLTFCTVEEEKKSNYVSDEGSHLKLTPSEVVFTVVPEFGGKGKRGSKRTVIPSQENIVSETYGTKEQVVTRTCALEDYVDFAQHDNCVQMTRIFTKEVLLHTSAQIMLENTYVFNIVTGKSQVVLLKTNKFVKQVSILPTFIFVSHFFLLKRLLTEI